MKQSSLKLTVTLTVCAVCVVGILAYVSVLGENHQINRIITTYFGKLKDGMYLEACDTFASNFQDERFPNTVRQLTAAIDRLEEDFETGRLDEEVYREKQKALKERIQEIVDEQRMNFNFFLELSLLKYYNLIDQDEYKVELKRSNFWIPFISDDSVHVSIVLKPKGNEEILDVLSSDHSGKLIDNLIVVGREKGRWKIRRFAIADSAIAGIYNELRRDIDVNKYVAMTPDGLRFQNAEINLKALTPTDKRLLKFSLYKIQQVLGVSPQKTEGFPMP